MGYISPITQYEYIQYTNRTIEAEKVSKNMISRFKPVQPIKFQHKSEEHDENNRDIYSNDYQFSSNHIYKRYVPKELVEKTATEVTGIGQFLSLIHI